MILKNKNFLLYVLGRFVSIIGSGIMNISIILYIIDTTSSGVMIAIFALMTTIPRLLLLPISGVIGDVWNRKYIMVITDLLSGVLVVLLLLLMSFDIANLYTIFFVQALLSMLSILFRSATRAMIPELVCESELARSNATIKGFENLSQILAPIIGVIIFNFGGLDLILIINGASFLISGVSECFIVYKRRLGKETLSIGKTYTKFAEGFKFIRENEGLRQICYLYLFTSTLFIPMLSVVVPFVLKEVVFFSDFQFSLLESMYLVGMLIGSISVTILLSRYKAKVLIKTGLVMNAVVILVFALLITPTVINVFSGAIWLHMVIIGFVLAMMGAIDIIYDTPVETNMQLMIPNNMRSRVLATTQFIFGLGIPLGQSLFGYLIDRYDITLVLFMIGIMYTLGILIFLWKANEKVYGDESKLDLVS